MKDFVTFPHQSDQIRRQIEKTRFLFDNLETNRNFLKKYSIMSVYIHNIKHENIFESSII